MNSSHGLALQENTSLYILAASNSSIWNCSVRCKQLRQVYFLSLGLLTDLADRIVVDYCVVGNSKAQKSIVLLVFYHHPSEYFHLPQTEKIRSH